MGRGRLTSREGRVRSRSCALACIAACLVVHAVLSAGCGSEDDAGGARTLGHAVTTVSAAEVREVALAAGWDGKRALSLLTDFEALSAEAEARGYGVRPEVVSETRRAAVKAFVRREVTEALTLKDVPAAMVDAAYEAKKDEFVHGERRRAAHVLCRAEGHPEGAEPLSDAQTEALMSEVEADARAAVGELVPSKGPLTEAQLRAFTARYASKRFVLGRGLVESDEDEGPSCVLYAEVLSPTETNGAFVRPFLDGLFALPPTPGVLSGPVRTSFGVHVILLSEITAARNVDRDGADAELRARLLPRVRAERFAQILEAAQRAYPVDTLGRDVAAQIGALEFTFDER